MCTFQVGWVLQSSFSSAGFLFHAFFWQKSVRRENWISRHFFTRRFIRLLPPLVLMYVVMVPILYFHLPEKFTWASAFYNFFYLGNFYGLFENFTSEATGPTAFGALWSLAVEEHFYLMLPLLFVFVTEIKARVFSLLVFAIFFPIVLRGAVFYFLPADLADSFNYSFTFTRIDSISWGVMLSILLHAGLLKSKFIDQISTYLIAIGIFGTLAATYHWSEEFTIVWRYTLQTLAIGCGFAAVILAPRTSWLRGMLEIKIFSFLGRASYEIYIWHLPIFFLFEAYVENCYLATGGSLVMTLTIASLAYIWTNSRTRALRRRFGSHL